MTWTQELRKTAEIVSARLRAAMTQPDANPLHRDAHIVISQALAALESRQTELDAARRCADAAIALIPPFPESDNEVTKYEKPEWREWKDAKRAYDAARAEQEMS